MNLKVNTDHFTPTGMIIIKKTNTNAGDQWLVQWLRTHCPGPRVSSPVRGFPGGSEGKASAYNAGDLGLIPGSGRSPGEGNGNPLQYCCLGNPMDGEAW